MVNMAATIAYKVKPADFAAAFSKVLRWLDSYASDRALIIMTLVSLALLAVLSRDDRRRIFWPMVIGAVVILNPVLYYYIYYRIIYWRLFWLLPDTVIIALACVRLLERLPARFIRIPVFVLLCALIMFLGRYTYGESSFTKNVNPEGVSDATHAVADYLLSREESPLCLVESSLYMDIRQYDGNIRLVYGRNAEGYITRAKRSARRAAAAMRKEKTPYRRVLKFAVSRKCSYIVVDKTDPIPKALRDKYKYEKVRTIFDYIVYHRDFTETPAA